MVVRKKRERRVDGKYKAKRNFEDAGLLDPRHQWRGSASLTRVRPTAECVFLSDGSYVRPCDISSYGSPSHTIRHMPDLLLARQ